VLVDEGRACGVCGGLEILRALAGERRNSH
jgi:hypothetical protein